MINIEELAIQIYAACYIQYGMVHGCHDLTKIPPEKAFKMLSNEQRNMHLDQAKAAYNWIKNKGLLKNEENN